MPKRSFIKLDMTLLIVEPNQAKLDLMLRLLKVKVGKVYIARNGREALEVFREYRPQVVLTGLKMPGMDGIRMSASMKRVDKNVRIVLITPRSPDKVLPGSFARSVLAGVDHYIISPLAGVTLVSLLNRINLIFSLEKLSEKQSDLIQKLSRAVAQSPNSVNITDIYGNIEYVNPKFEEITGYRKEEVIGKNARILKSGKTTAQTYRNLAKCLAAGKVWHGEFINRRKTGEFYWEMASISPIKNEDGTITHYVFVGEDHTAKKRAEEALLLSERNLRKRNEMIEQDLKNAQFIQRALLPRELPVMKEIRIDYRYIPMESVGGDFFSMTQLREGGLGVFLGDVTGHGVSAALFLALVKAFTDRACRQHGRDPKSYFSMLNEDLLNNMTTNFLTAVYGVFNPVPEQKKVLFTFAKGGHPPPMIYRAATGDVEIVDVNGTLLGMLQSVDFEQKTVELEKGDKIFLYTDGINETIDVKNNFFGLEGLSDAIRASGGSELSQTLDAIIKAVHRYRGKALVKDDIVILGFQINI